MFPAKLISSIELFTLDNINILTVFLVSKSINAVADRKYTGGKAVALSTEWQWKVCNFKETVMCGFVVGKL